MVVTVNMVAVLKDSELPGSSGSGHSDDSGPAQDFHLLLRLDFLVSGELTLKQTKFPLSSVGKEVRLVFTQKNCSLLKGYSYLASLSISNKD